MVEKLPIAVAHISRPVMAKVFSYILEEWPTQAKSDLRTYAFF